MSFDQEIVDMVLGPLSGDLILADGKNVYWVDTADMQINKKIQVDLADNQYICDLEVAFHKNELIRIKTCFYDIGKVTTVCYPQDSTYYFNSRDDKMVLRAPGYHDYYVDVNGHIIGTYINFHAFTNTFGKGMYRIDSTGIVNLTTKLNKPLSGEVAGLAISPDTQSIALLYLISNQNSVDHSYLLELRNYSSFEIMAQTKINWDMASINRNVIRMPAHPGLYYSATGKDIVIEKDLSHYIEGSYSEEDWVRSFSAVDLSEMDYFSTLQKRSQIGALTWLKYDGDVIALDPKTGALKKQIWSNLTPLFSFEGFYASPKYVYLYGKLENQSNASGLYKFSLKDEVIYTDLAMEGDTVSLYSGKETIILNNEISDGNMQHGERIAIVDDGKKVQVWDVRSRTKIREISFKNEHQVFLSKDQSSLLVFQKLDGKSYSDFSVGLLDLENGILKSRSYVNIPYGNFSLNGEVQVVPMDQHHFICSSFGSALWRLDTRDLSFTPLCEYKDPNFEYTKINSMLWMDSLNKLVLNYELSDMDYNADFAITSVVSMEIEANSNDITPATPDRMFSYTAKEKFSNSGLRYLQAYSNREVIYQEDGKLVIQDIPTGSETKIKIPANTKLQSCVKTTSAKYLLLNNDSLEFWSMDDKHQIKNSFKLPDSKNYFISDQGITLFHHSGKYHYVPERNVIVKEEKLKPYFTQSSSLTLATNGLMLFNDQWLIDQNNLTLVNELHSFQLHALVENGSKLLKVANSWDEKHKAYFKILLTDPLDTSKIYWKSELHKQEGGFLEGLNRLILSPDQKQAIFWYEPLFEESKECFLFNLESKEIKHFKPKKSFYSIRFIGKQNDIYFYSKQQYGTAKTSNPAAYTQDLKHIPTDGVSSRDTTFYIDFQNLVLVKDGKKLRHYARSYLNTAMELPQQNMLVASSEGKLFFWKVGAPSPIKILEIGEKEIIYLQIQGKLLYCLHKDSEISIVNLSELSVAARLLMLDDNERPSMVWITPEGYFSASKKSIRNYHFAQGLKTFPISKDELILNRPDTILSRLGYADRQWIEVYKSAYQKRLKRNDFEKLTASHVGPVVRILNKHDIPLIVSDTVVKVELEVDQSAAELELVINGVPVEHYTESPYSTIKLPLHEGENQVSFIASNAQGVSSAEESFSVYSKTNSKSTLHYFGIGVSKYQDSTKNLNYADKDIRSLAAYFSKRFPLEIRIDTFLNDNATLENILSIRSKLEQTGVNDKVIISLSGHGMVKDEEFYFGTHDIDFKQVEKRGLSYDQLYDLLDHIPARRKLILIDACHSGELDLTADEEATKVKPGEQEGSKGIIVEDEVQLTDQSFTLMKNLFYDMHRGNGSYIISASGAEEYAFEDQKVANGYFTYALMESMDELSSYTWSSDKQDVTISRLQEAVYEKVVKLSNGLQKPTYRSENIEWDWSLIELEE